MSTEEGLLCGYANISHRSGLLLGHNSDAFEISILLPRLIAPPASGCGWIVVQAAHFLHAVGLDPG